MDEYEYLSALHDFEHMIEETYGIPFSRVQELAAADANGKVLILPDCSKCANFGGLCNECVGVQTESFFVEKQD